MLKRSEITLCAGRHETPVPEAIFETVNPADSFESMESIAVSRLDAIIPKEYIVRDAGRYTAFPLDYSDRAAEFRAVSLVIYVAGYTPALMAAINACQRLAIAEVVLMHYDRDTGGYRPQTVRIGA